MAEREGSRKLEAILAADVAGYSRLMQEDDEATVATLEAYRAVFREKIQSHRGRVVDMAGDSVLAVFRSRQEPRARCLRCRPCWLTATRRCVRRAGCAFIRVNLGEVTERPDGTVYGDGVNIAVRLEPGALAASRATKTMPAVAATIGDPVGAGVAVSLAHPGGNLIGMSFQFDEGIPGKWLELLQGVVPRLSTVVVLSNPGNPAWRAVEQLIENAARERSIETVVLWSAAITFAGIELMHMIRKGQLQSSEGGRTSAAQFFPGRIKRPQGNVFACSRENFPTEPEIPGGAHVSRCAGESVLDEQLKQ